MGSEAARPIENHAPPSTTQPSFNVDLSDAKDVKSVFGYNPLCEIGPSNKLPHFGAQDMRNLAEGKPSDILGPAARRDGITLPQTKIVDGDVVIEGLPPAPADSERTGVPKTEGATLNQNTLEAGKVGKLEGYHQVASRLLGAGFDNNELKEFRNALRDSWKSQPGHHDAKHLNRGDELLSQKNMDSVLNLIKNEGLRGRIRERLMSGEAQPASDHERHERTNKRDERPKRHRREDEPTEDVPSKVKPSSESPRPNERNRKTPSDEILPHQTDRIPTDRLLGGTPRDPQAVFDDLKDPFEQPKKTEALEGQFKSPFERRYDVGDRFKGLSSVYSYASSTASGVPFDRHEMTAASREFPFGTVLKVTNPDNGREARVVVTDHGPFAGKMMTRPDGTKTHARVLDLSSGAASAIGMGSTVKQLEIAVESIPVNGKWGSDRRNIHGDYKRAVIADVRRLALRG